MATKSSGASTKSAQTGTAGVIAINPAVLQQQSRPASQQVKSAARLKVVIRRLPPCLTKDEFVSIIGNDWRVGGGKVDWLEYRVGKIRSPGKLPEQSRAYLHLLNDTLVAQLEAKFLSVTFHDVKGSYQHPDLKQWLPLLEYAPCQRIPPSKARQDNRQGLIDQDVEYMAFLEGETQVQPKPASLEATAMERTKEIIKTTPLIEALRERKAAKAKSAAAKAASKKDRDVPDATEKVKTPATRTKKESATATKTPGRSEAKAVDATKASAKIDLATKAKESSSNTTPGASPAPARKRERAPASIKSLLERDLGLAKPARRGAKDAPATTETPKGPGVSAAQRDSSVSSEQARPSRTTKAVTTESQATQTTASPVKSIPTASSPRPQPAAASTAKAASSNRTTDSSKAHTSQSKGQRGAAKPMPGAKKAYIKHANASQGITEALLSTALSEFGEVVSLDIDKRKGTALVEFKTAEALASAMAKRTIPVAQGAVEVLEFKDKSAAATASTTASNSGSGSGRNGAAGNNNAARETRGANNASKGTRSASTVTGAANGRGNAARAKGEQGKGRGGGGGGGSRAVSAVAGSTVTTPSMPAAPSAPSASSAPSAPSAPPAPLAPSAPG